MTMEIFEDLLSENYERVCDILIAIRMVPINIYEHVLDMLTSYMKRTVSFV